MKTRRTIWLVLAALLALGIAPVRATDTHDYTSGEYAIIRDGLAPDKRKSLAAHGDGEGGSENFHVWLMAEPAHRRIAALDDIGDSNNLDTGPDAYHARWSDDSHHVAVAFRSGRHEVQLNLYRVASGSAHLIAGPSLFREVTSREVGADDDVRQSVSGIEWHGPRRFVLRERHLFLTSDPGFARRLGAYGRVTDKADDGRPFVEFSAEADCLLMPGNRYRVVDLRVSKSGDGGSW
jgi:hypothetical protein